MPTTDWGGSGCAEAMTIVLETNEMRIAPRKLNCMMMKLTEEKGLGGLEFLQIGCDGSISFLQSDTPTMARVIYRIAVDLPGLDLETSKNTN